MIEQLQERDSRPVILVVDDESSIRTLIRRAINREDLGEVFEAGDGIEAQAVLAERPVDLVITDLAMPNLDGMGLMEWAQEQSPGSTWIILTGFGTFDDALRAIHLGAFEFFAKPLESMDSLVVAARNALRQRELLAEQQRLQNDIQQRNEQLRGQVDQLQQACNLLCQQAELLGEDLRRAELIQRALLPRAAPSLHGFSVHALYRSSRNVGGDVYDIIRLDDRYLAAYVADAAGHGVSAAMLAVLFKHRLSLWPTDSPRPARPADVLAGVNRQISQECSAPGLFITAVYCLLDTATGELQIASAGHPPVLIHHANDDVERVDHTGPALGLSPEASYDQRQIHIASGARILMYTDGLVECEDKDPLTQQARISQVLGDRSFQGQPLLQAVMSATGAGMGEEMTQDDITVLLLSAKEAPSTIDNGQMHPVTTPAETPPPAHAQVLIGTEDDQTTLSVRGQANWTYSAAFHEACLAELDAGRSLTIDLSACDHLDSTFLGTILEVVDRGDARDRRVRLQGIKPAVRHLFEELVMDRVIDHLDPNLRPLPSRMASLEASHVPDQRSHMRILRAHEGLAQLSEHNRKQFVRLVEMLRHDLAAKAADGEAPSP